jgi:hypothetical protein
MSLRFHYFNEILEVVNVGGVTKVDEDSHGKVLGVPGVPKVLKVLRVLGVLKVLKVFGW